MEGFFFKLSDERLMAKPMKLREVILKVTTDSITVTIFDEFIDNMNNKTDYSLTCGRVAKHM